MGDSAEPSMTPEEARQFVEHLKSDPEIHELMAAPEPGPSPTEAGACLGLGYPLGTGFIKPPPAAVMVRLSMIDSPLLGGLDNLTEMDPYRALYAIAGPADALQPIMGLAGRLAALDRLRAWAEQKPERMAVWLDRQDAIAHKAWAEYDRAAIEFAAGFGPVGGAEIARVVFQVIRDARAGLDQLPVDTGQKKTAPDGADTTANG